MCGIAGVFVYRPQTGAVREAELIEIREAMAKRGPDGAALWVSDDRRTGLAHRRLAIIGPDERGAQPMRTPDGRYRVVFNGEIYNYRELRRELEARGRRFVSDTDTEVLLYLYADEGAAMIKRLRGMFAFAIHDSESQTLFLARDPFGIKPLYYADDGTTLKFASQVKALLRAEGIRTEPSPAGHVGFYLWGHVPDPHTLYEGIKALPAGTTLTVNAEHRGEPRRYFDIAAELAAAAEALPATLGRDEARERVREALKESVRYHLVSDVPVGLFLSSGIDSAAIAGLASEISGARLRAITLGFQEYAGTPNDETPGAALTAAHYGAGHEIHWITRREFEAEAGAVLDAMDQPSIDGINTYFVSRAAARSGLKVALSGLGSDELFAGYPSFRQIPKLVRRVAAMRLPHSFGAAVRRMTAPAVSRLTSPKYAGLLEYGGTYGGAYLLRRGLFMPWELPALVGEDFARRGLEELATLPALARTHERVRLPQQRVSALELSWYMRSQLLRDSDWSGMAHSLEIRVPFVDVPLFRTVAAVSARVAVGKQDVAAAPAKPLPRSIAERAKTGFAVPVRDWLHAGRPLHASLRGLRAWACVVKPPEVRSLRVLALVPEAFGGRGGIAQYNRDFLRAVAEHPETAEVVVVPRLMPDAPGRLPERVTQEHQSVGGKLRYIAQVAKVIARCRRFDVIVCAHINFLPIAHAAAALTGGRVLLQLHGIEIWQPPASALARRAASAVFGYIAVSRLSEERFRAWARPSNARGYHLPGSVSLSAFCPGPRDEGLARRYGIGRRRVLLTLGRLASGERYKGFDEVLEVLPRLLRRAPDLVYLIAGDGDDRPRLERKAAELGVYEHVIFAGFVPEADKAALYRLADVYVHPSRGEGFGFVVIEALASGVPTIASKLDGSREAVRNGELGLLVDPADGDEIEGAILSALDSEKGARRSGVEFFSYETFRSSLHRIIDDALGVAQHDRPAASRALEPKPRA